MAGVSCQRPLLLTGNPVNGRQYLIDLARSRHANPLRIPVSPSDRRYQHAEPVSQLGATSPQANQSQRLDSVAEALFRTTALAVVRPL